MTDESANIGEVTTTRTKVFDSGATTHISPYCDEFSVFKTIPPHPLHAANKQAFNVVRKGEVMLSLPNGITSSQLHLNKVLYSPKAGYTLVSISQLDDAGFLTTFTNGTCTI